MMAKSGADGRDVYEELRREMVERQIADRDIDDELVLSAMLEVPRHSFVPPAMRARAYHDSPLPLSQGQTISQPYIVALMTELLELNGDETVLEVGTGSGYQAAVLSRIARFVYSIERIEELATSARERLAELGYENIEVVVGDGSAGLPEHAPYQGIIVTAGAPDIPPKLVEQLDDGGRMVVPVGPSNLQTLKVVKRNRGRVSVKEEGACVFVPLLGSYGWKRGSAR